MNSRPVLAEPPPPAIPALQFRHVGEGVSGAIADIVELQDRDFNTGNPKTWDNGDPVMVTRVTLVVTGVGNNIHAADEPVKVGNNVRLWVRGQNRKAWRDALYKHRVGLEVGDIVTAAYTADEQTRRGWNPRKVLSFNVQKPRSDLETKAGDKAFDLFELLNRETKTPEYHPPTKPAASGEEVMENVKHQKPVPTAYVWEGEGPPPAWGPVISDELADDEPF